MAAEWITPEQLSATTGLSLSRLKNQRYERIVSPRSPIAGTREVVYKKAEVDAIIKTGRIGTQEGMPGVGALGGTSR